MSEHPDLMGNLQRSLGLPERPATEPSEHRPIERKVYVTVIEDGSVDSVEEYREVCVTCVPKYSAYKPWPCPLAAGAAR